MEVMMKDIGKSFGANAVLGAVDFELKTGEIHALMGENGAGKSTLMNILAGLHQRDRGKIFIDGREKYFRSVKEAEEFGITYIHQEMNTFPEMTVLENMYLNREPKTVFGLLDTKSMVHRAHDVFNDLGISLDLDAAAGSLSVGRQQLLEIAKSLMLNGQVLIMDEPTAALSETEISRLFTIIRALKEKGVAIVYISHRMEEIFALCDRITVMRDGVSVSRYNASEVDAERIVRDMVGRDIGDFYPRKTSPLGAVKFEVKGFTSGTSFRDVSFAVRAGEILGFSGLMGSGRTEIMRAVFGIDAHDSGEILLDGKKITLRRPSDAVKRGIGFLTENRKDEGLILDLSVADNILLPSVDALARHGILEKKTADDFVGPLLQRLRVRAESRRASVNRLSGGNQQKVVLAKWIGVRPQVLIVDEPTRGVDVGAKREIYLLMNELAERGVALIVVSSDLPEVLSISDRIVVIREGRVAGELSRTEGTQEKILKLATGGR